MCPNKKLYLKGFSIFFFVVCFNPFGLFLDYLQQHMSRSQEGLKFTEYKQNYSSGKCNFLFAKKKKRTIFLKRILSVHHTSYFKFYLVLF